MLLVGLAHAKKLCKWHRHWYPALPSMTARHTKLRAKAQSYQKTSYTLAQQRQAKAKTQSRERKWPTSPRFTNLAHTKTLLNNWAWRNYPAASHKAARLCALSLVLPYSATLYYHDCYRCWFVSTASSSTNRLINSFPQLLHIAKILVDNPPVDPYYRGSTWIKKVLKNKKRKYFKQRLLAGRCFYFQWLFHQNQTKNTEPLELGILCGGAAGYRTPVRAVIVYPSTNIVRLCTYVAKNAQNAA